MAAPSLTYTLTNGSTADATQVMQNFTDLLNGITDGTKDLSISALTAAGTATLNGHVNLGNSSSDDLSVTASLASSIPVKTTASFDIGSSSLGLRSVYFGANSQTVRVIGSNSMSSTWTMTLPVTAGSDGYRLVTNGSGVTSWSKETKGTATNDLAGTGNVGEIQVQSLNRASANSLASNTPENLVASTVDLTAGQWRISGIIEFLGGSGSSISNINVSLSTTTDTMTGSAIPDSSGQVWIQRQIATTVGTNEHDLPIPTYDIQIASPVSLYIVVRAAFTGGTMSAYGRVQAVRSR